MIPVNRAEFRSANMIKAGDTRNEIRVRLLEYTDAPINLAGKTVTWSAAQNKMLVLDRAATVYTNGEVGIRFNLADAVKKGPLYLQFEVDHGGGLIERFPADGNLFLKIT